MKYLHPIIYRGANMTEQLKADNAMLWVQKTNEIQSRVREIIYSEIIHA